jgi:hypothetical protein
MEGEPDARRQLTPGVINRRAMARAGKSSQPLSYYGPESGVGLALAVQSQPGRRIGVIGSAPGTIAVWWAGDVVLRHQPASRRHRAQRVHLSVRQQGANRCARRARWCWSEPAQRFDLLAVDAFSGDAIPVHLLTRSVRGLPAPSEPRRNSRDPRRTAISTSPVTKDIADSPAWRRCVQEEADSVVAGTDWVLISRKGKC